MSDEGLLVTERKKAKALRYTSWCPGVHFQLLASTIIMIAGASLEENFLLPTIMLEIEFATLCSLCSVRFHVINMIPTSRGEAQSCDHDKD